MSSTITFTFEWPKSEEWTYAVINSKGELDFYPCYPREDDLFIDDDTDDPATVTPVIVKRPS